MIRFSAVLSPWTLRGLALLAIVAFALSHWHAQAQSPPGPTPAPVTTVDTRVEPSADAPPGSSQSLLGIIKEGAGPLVIPMLVCSFILLIFAFERSIALRAGRVIPGPFVKRFLHQLREGQLDREQAILVCEENGSPVAKIFGAAAKKWGKAGVEVEQAIIDAGERAAHELRRYLRVFNGVATVSPMFGLLGTVFGMIHAFSDIAGSHAMGRPELLAKGISEALVMTALGLTVAIPALVLYWSFAGQADRLIVKIDTLGQDVVAAISAEALQEAAKARKSRAA